MKTAAKIILALLFIPALFSCEREDTNTPELDALILGTWVLTKITADPPLDHQGNGQPLVDLTPVWPACKKDNRLTFAAQNRLFFDEGASTCVEGNAQQMTGFWDFNTFKTHVSFSYGDETQSWEILTITNTHLVVNFESRAYKGHVFTATYEKL